MGDWVSQIFLVLSLSRAGLQLFFGILLQCVRELMAVLDASSTHLQTVADLFYSVACVIEAVHWAFGWLVIQSVELFVQKREPCYLSRLKSLVQVSEHLSRHIVHSLLVLVDSEKFTHLLVSFVVWVEVHLRLFLQLLPGLILIFFPVSLLLVPEKGWFGFFIGFLFLCLRDLELQFPFFLDSSFLLKKVEVWKVNLSRCMLSLLWFFSKSALLIGERFLNWFWRRLCFCRILFVLVEIYLDWLWHYKCLI